MGPNAIGLADDEKEWDEFFSDPTDDVILRSADGIHFRASSHRLSNASWLFKDMFSTIGKEKKHSEEVIEMAFQAQAIRVFLELVTSPPNTNVDVSSDFSVAQELLQLVQQYDCPAFMEIADSYHSASVQGDPLIAFAWASGHDDVDLAKRALKCSGNDPLWRGYPVTNSLVTFLDFLEEISPNWRSYTLQLLLEESQGQSASKRFRSTPALIRIRSRWADIAHRFDPHGTAGVKNDGASETAEAS